MTVSSTQPQDGSNSAAHRASGHRVDTPHSPEPLPPTLFALPNLRADVSHTGAGQRPDSDPYAGTDPKTQEPKSTQQTAPLQEQDSISTTVGYGDDRFHYSVASETVYSEEKIIRHDQPVVIGEIASPDQRQSNDGQAYVDAASFVDATDDESWLDRLGSHAIVLTMLLVVFGIALLAGRKPIVDSTETNTDIAEIIETPETTTIETARPGIAAQVQTQSAYESMVPAMTMAKNADPTVEGAHQAETLEAPQTQTGVSASTVSSRSANVTNDDSASIESTTIQVDTVVPTLSSPVGAVPSIDALGSAAPTSPGATTASGYRHSKTPNKVSDWSRYFILPEESYVTPTSATMPPR